jgi:ring-1,2-phenylacetyl-CoA epoxidase subunit PaaD
VSRAATASPRVAAGAARGALSDAAWTALAEVADPEIPGLSIVDLGIVRSVVGTEAGIRVEILPTFVGCPAIDLIRALIADRLADMADVVQVEVSFAEPWTSDRITPAGRVKLRRSGIAPPAPGARADPSLISLEAAPRCPWCGSRRTRWESRFGPTACRAVAYCLACRQPFDAFKSV